MNIWAVSNQKGGVGKTTTAITLAAWLSMRNEKVLLIDIDPHASMSSYFGYDTDSETHGVYQLFQMAVNKQDMDVNPLIIPTKYDNLHLLPSSISIATLDRQLGTRDGMGLVLAKTAQGLKDNYQHILIDCPPMLGVLMINALAACNKLLIPVQTEFLALKGLDRMLGTLAMINKARKKPLDYSIIPTMFDRRTRASIETLRTIKEKYAGEHLANSVIPIDTRFREASTKGIPLPLIYPHTRGATAYNILLDSLLENEN